MFRDHCFSFLLIGDRYIMGYTTDFSGEIDIAPALNSEEIEFLNKFANTRRMNRKKGPYFVDGSGDYGQGNDSDIISHNTPADGQPGLWCQWLPSEKGDFLEWDQNEKFYNAAEWMLYLIDHFLGVFAISRKELPFFNDHVLNGTISAQGEDSEDQWLLHVENNVVSVEQMQSLPSGEKTIISL